MVGGEGDGQAAGNTTGTAPLHSPDDIASGRNLDTVDGALHGR